MKCPQCGGEGKTEALACPGAHMITLECQWCSGTGNVPENFLEIKARGSQCHMIRVQRGVHLTSLAEQFGITIVELSRMERGVTPVSQAYIDWCKD